MRYVPRTTSEEIEATRDALRALAFLVVVTLAEDLERIVRSLRRWL